MEVPRLLELMEPATFYTLAMGVPAEAHGRCLPFVWDPGAMRMRLGAARRALPAVWDRMTRAGLRSLVIDAYEIPEPAEIDGAFIRGLQHRNRVSVPRADSPRELGREARRALGRPPVLNEIYGRPSAGKLRREREGFLRGALKPAEAVELLLPRVEPDLLWVTMISPHVAGHRFWNLSQASGDTAGLEAPSTTCTPARTRGSAASPPRCPSGADLIVVVARRHDVRTTAGSTCSRRWSTPFRRWGRTGPRIRARTELGVADPRACPGRPARARGGPAARAHRAGPDAEDGHAAARLVAARG